MDTVKRFTQKMDYPNSVTFVGTGKLQEIKEYVVENEIGLVIFDDELSPKQLRNIEKELQVKILDRTSLILISLQLCTDRPCEDTGGACTI